MTRRRYDLLDTRVIRAIEKRSRRDQTRPGERRRLQTQHKRREWPSNRPPSLNEIFRAGNLTDTFYRLKSQGGPAPGPDGVSYDALSHREVCQIMRQLSSEIVERRYRPSRPRYVPISKGPGRGTRRLSLRSICNRVVSAALNAALSPFWESRFSPRSFGFRRQLSVWDLLIAVERSILEGGRTVIVEHDVYHAFDEVPIDHAMAAHREHINDEQLLFLIDTILRGEQADARTVGIDQGDNYSPVALNVLLHRYLDSQFSADEASPLMFRYADNIPLLEHSVPEARQAADRLQTLLSEIGMRLKDGKNQPVDLRQPDSQVKLLGLTLRLESNRIVYMLDEECWRGLERGIQEAHDSVGPSETANAVIHGWIEAIAPCLVSLQMEPLREKILSKAALAGFREVPKEEVRRWLQSSRDRWRSYRDHHGPWGKEREPSLVVAVPSGDRGPDRECIDESRIPEAGSADPASVDAGCPF
ncbi:MAG: hypothetical protein DWQ31_18255 [Planctomycetota bacterium]|nr:MAG: hypothetical protein DWQ31_18255 [Planctomycetota bacterium]REJ87307.1 MAG: hypothetical protein DWQ35_21595 [Planctomycetota bacterium]REK22680.1 MAG: hypothetical protein DWQ42_16650 [Planctomycetota bacterium]REK42487.1 MAG: hypothetical protein DWQ46_12940 [Planctomycetota bacterium]